MTTAPSQRPFTSTRERSGGVRGGSIPLSQLRRGDSGRIMQSELSEDDASLLRAMGLRTNTPLRVCRSGQPCIVQVHDHCNAGCRIALAKDLAKRVRVLPVTA